MEKYTLPLIKDEKEKQIFAEEIAVLRSEIEDYYINYFAKGYNKDINNPLSMHVDRLIGSLEGENGGMLGKLFSEAVSPGIKIIPDTITSQEKKSTNL